MSKVITADQAAALIKDGATVAATGFGLAGWAEEVGVSIEKRFVETGHPAGITFIHASNIAAWNHKGIERFAKEGLVKRWIGAFIGAARTMSKFAAEDKMEAYCLPQGVLAQLYREIAARRPGILSKVGMGTFVDPRVEGGKMNSVTTEDIVKVVEFEGEEWLFYKSFPIDVALIRGTVVDERGNLTMDREGLLLEALSLAQATRNTGGIIIAQAEYLAKAGSLFPKDVTVPGILVDHIVVATSTENSFQSEALYFSPAFAGHVKVPLHHIPTPPLDERVIIARRAAMELSPGAVVNLGVGIPTMVGSVAAEENVSHLMTMTTEAGNIGGVPANPPNFAHAYNAEATIRQDDQFASYDGGGLDLAFLGLAQTDKDGNVNVSKFNNRIMGCGGFIDITQNTGKVVFCGTFTDGMKATIEDGRMTIAHEGTGRKFVDQVEQITFSGRYASATGQNVLFVTERAVFTLEEGTMTLIEIAPGIELEKDIIALMGFTPRISPDLRLMPPEIFSPAWGKLADVVGSRKKMVR